MDIGIKNRKVTLVLFLLLLLVSGIVLVRGTGQPYRGSERTLPGLGDEAEVRWDRWGVPHIRAGSEADLARLLGWVHANDRLTQMELGRRAGRGLLSEAFGEDFLEADLYFRTLRLEETAERMYEKAGESSRRWLDAYADGVNAWVADRGRSLPPEIRLLGIDIEPWRPRDGYLFALLMAVDLSFWDDRPEEERFGWLRHFGAEGLRELLEDPDVHIPQQIAAMASETWTPPAPRHREDVEDGDVLPDADVGPQIGHTLGPGVGSSGTASGSLPEEVALGSNNWAIGGSRAAGGQPMVANDPHLGLHLPSVWYQVHLRSPDFEVQGMTLPGTPGVVIGRGRHVAWAMTNVMLDDHDVYFEHLDDTGDHVLRDGAWVPVESEDVTIPIRGGDERTVRLRRTELGPLLEADVLQGLPARSLRWTAHPTSGSVADPMLALYRLARASSVDEALAATETYICPAQNLVLTFGPESQDPGAVVYTVLGGIPDRRTGDGRLPSPGWDPSYDWNGLRPRETNPVVREHDDGILVTANHDIRPDGYDKPLTADFFPPYRADRIRDRLLERSDWDVDGFSGVQTDVRSPFARRLSVALGSGFPGDAGKAADALSGWDGTLSATDGTVESGTAALLVRVQKHLMLKIFADEQKAAKLAKPIGHRSSLLALLEGELSDRWWDDVSTPQAEGRNEILQAALDEAWNEGAARWGDELSKWDHGWLHQLTLRHRLDAVPVLGWWLRRGPWQLPGHATTVLALGATWEADLTRQRITYGPSMRWVVDWSDPERGWSVLPGGQAGHPADPHYSDQMDLWLAGELKESPWSEEAVAEATVATTRFVPGS